MSHMTTFPGKLTIKQIAQAASKIEGKTVVLKVDAKLLAKEIRTELIAAAAKGDCGFKLSKSTRMKMTPKGTLLRLTRFGNWRRFLARDEIKSILCIPEHIRVEITK